MTKAMYKTNPIRGGRTCDLVKAFCKTNPIFVGRHCWESSYLYHSGVAVLCVLCVSAVKLPFCKTKPILGKPMPGTRIAKRTQFLPEGLAKKAVIHCHPDVAVLCVLCVSVVELPFCKTNPISGKPMPGTLIAKRTQFSSEGIAGKVVISAILTWPFSVSSVSLW
jgi:hypothetical protein